MQSQDNHCWSIRKDMPQKNSLIKQWKTSIQRGTRRSPQCSTDQWRSRLLLYPLSCRLSSQAAKRSIMDKYQVSRKFHLDLHWSIADRDESWSGHLSRTDHCSREREKQSSSAHQSEWRLILSETEMVSLAFSDGTNGHDYHCDRFPRSKCRRGIDVICLFLG